MTGLVLAGALAGQILGTTTAVSVVNGERTGHIEVLVNGKEYLKTYEELVPDGHNNVKKVKKSVVWQAGPTNAIEVRVKNWGVRSESILIIVRYFDDAGTLIGMSRPREFSPQSGDPRWLFTRTDLVR